MPYYSVSHWNEHFENSNTKKIKGALNWVPIPTKHDGKSFKRLMRMERGFDVYAAWILIVQVAAKCPVRGVLIDRDGELTPEDLQDKTDAPSEIFEHALEVLSSPRIGWMTRNEGPASERIRTHPDGNEESGLQERKVNTHSECLPIPKSDAGAPIAVSGVGDRADSDSVFRNVTDGVLADTAKLRSWFEWQASSPEGTRGCVLSASDADWVLCVAAAEHVMKARKARSRSRLFASIVGRKDWSTITPSQLDKAKEKIRKGNF